MSELSRRLRYKHKRICVRLHVSLQPTEHDFCSVCDGVAGSWPCDAILAAAEIEALEADKTRLDWLEAQAVMQTSGISYFREADLDAMDDAIIKCFPPDRDTLVGIFTVLCGDPDIGDGYGACGQGSNLRSAIDAARSAEGGSDGE